jgi:cysteine desulfurase
VGSYGRGVESERGDAGVNPVHLDAASAEPMHPKARETLLAALDSGWSDPAALHAAGRRARLLLDNAREVVAALLAARPDEVTFLHSGVAATHAGVLGAASARARVGSCVVHSAVEHSAVLHAASWLASRGGTSVSVGVDRHGTVSVEDFTEAVAGPGVAVACLQAANHEVATTQPVTEVAAACASNGVPLLMDASHAAGRVPLPTGWSLLAAAARSWGGPDGVGVLVVRKGTRWHDPFPPDERGFADVPGALAAAAALQAIVEERSSVAERQRFLVDRIRSRVAAEVPDVEVVGDPVQRLPHLVTFSCLYVGGEALVTELDRLGFAVASGSACTASTLEPSHVLAAMGVTTHGNIRVSLSRDTTGDDVDRFLDVLPGVVAGLRGEVGL